MGCNRCFGYGVTFRFAVLVLNPTALITAVAAEVTVKVFIDTVLVCTPAVNVIEAEVGFATAGRLLVSAMVSELAAGDANVIVSVEDTPPLTVVGERVIVEIDIGLTVILTVFVIVPNFADITGSCCADTPCEVIGYVAVDAPAATTTLAGTDAAEEMLLLSVTVVFTAAVPVRVTVPVLF